MVYVLSMEGKPLMPTERHGKVRRMLIDKRAYVVQTSPFTIKLLYTPKTNVIQSTFLNIDPNSRFAKAVKKDFSIILNNSNGLELYLSGNPTDFTEIEE